MNVSVMSKYTYTSANTLNDICKKLYCLICEMRLHLQIRKWYILYYLFQEGENVQFSHWVLTKFDSVSHGDLESAVTEGLWMGGVANLHSFHESNEAKFCQNKNAYEKEIGPQYSAPLSSFILRLAEYRCQRMRSTLKTKYIPPPSRKSYYTV